MKSIVAGMLLVLSVVANAQPSEAKRKQHFNTKQDIAAQGYDVVSYFTNNPQEGSEKYLFRYKGIIYYFSSEANRKSFQSAPDRYEPAYGGWCAYAMGATGEKVKIDPETYKIVEGKLYLFYNFWGNNTLSDWNKEEKKLKEAADKNWANLIR